MNLTKQTFREIFGETIDLTDERTRRDIYRVFCMHAVATGDVIPSREPGVEIPPPPATYLRDRLRSLPER